MTEEVTQAVVNEADAPAEPAAEATSAREEPSIDDLLKDYETKVKPDEPKPEQKAGGDDVERRVEERLRKFEEQIQRDRIQGQVDDLVGKLHTNTGISKKFVLGYLNTIAAENPKLSNAYFGASEKEKAKFVETFARDIRKELEASAVDKAATEDRAAVTAAVRGASTKAPVGDKPPDFSQMSDAEARAAMKKQYGYTPNF